jgi:hypothetical protein
MKRVVGFRSAWFCLVAVAVSASVAWATPKGTADRPQVMQGATNSSGPQSTFRTTDNILFEAYYYDNNAACDGVAPTFVQLFLFNQEGLFIGQFDAGSSPVNFFQDPSTKYRRLGKSFSHVASIPLVPGDYKFTFLVRDCTNAKSLVLPEFTVFSVVAP